MPPTTARLRKPARPPRTKYTQRARLSREGHSAGWSRRPPCKRSFGDEEINSIGGEAEKGDCQHHCIHCIIVAIGAEKADQETETFLRHDQFRRDQENKRQRQRGADAVE